MIKHIEEWIKSIPNPDERECFHMGYMSIMYGANETNCHFSLFSTPEKTRAWEAGVAQAKIDKEEIEKDK